MMIDCDRTNESNECDGELKQKRISRSIGGQELTKTWAYFDFCAQRNCFRVSLVSHEGSPIPVLTQDDIVRSEFRAPSSEFRAPRRKDHDEEWIQTSFVL